MDDRQELFDALDAFLHQLIGLAESEGLTVMADAEMSFTQVRTLMLLACSEPLPISAVAETLALSVHAAGRNIDRLVAIDLVERQENPDDRRVKLVSLTPRGRGLIEEHRATQQRALRTFIGRLPGDQVSAFAAVLRPIVTDGYFHASSPATHSLDHEDHR